MLPEQAGDAWGKAAGKLNLGWNRRQEVVNPSSQRLLKVQLGDPASIRETGTGKMAKVTFPLQFRGSVYHNLPPPSLCVLCVYTSYYLGAHVCGSRRLMLGVFLNHSPRYLFRQGFSLTPELMIRLDWLGGEISGSDPSVSTTPVLGLQAYSTLLSFLCVSWGAKLRTPGLHGKLFTD